MELQRNQKGLHRTQRQQRGGQNQRQPEQGMQPERRLILYFHNQRAGHNDRARQHNDEDGGTIAGIDERIVQSADRASRRQRQKARKQFPAAAARTFAGQPAQRALQDGGFGGEEFTHGTAV